MLRNQKSCALVQVGTPHIFPEAPVIQCTPLVIPDSSKFSPGHTAHLSPTVSIYMKIWPSGSTMPFGRPRQRAEQKIHWQGPREGALDTARLGPRFCGSLLTHTPGRPGAHSARANPTPFF